MSKTQDITILIKAGTLFDHMRADPAIIKLQTGMVEEVAEALKRKVNKLADDELLDKVRAMFDLHLTQEWGGKSGLSLTAQAVLTQAAKATLQAEAEKLVQSRLDAIFSVKIEQKFAEIVESYERRSNEFLATEVAKILQKRMVGVP